ncbi:retinoblastoma-associated protein-like [Ruditapes philippinarum]|uniref:retinoblastoma-associated protein-like n=1 Tax=Ruditapes philippinarum TaxID=129788 RepID=UPI00295AA567|nr:retinoblastoma-associated protein-like [Ruditapes philippinarum]
MDDSVESSNKGSTAEEEFERLSKVLSVSAEVKTKAWDVWQEFVSNTDQSNLRNGITDWLMLAIYTAVIDLSVSTKEEVVIYSRKPDGSVDDCIAYPSLTLTSILQQCGSNVITFTEKMRRFREEVRLSEAVRRHVMRVEKQYCISSPLYQKFHREWGTVFREEERSAVPFNQEGTNYRKELCWTLFLNAKERLMPDSHELIHLYYMLLTCLEFVLRDTPSFQLHPPFDMMKLKHMENLDENELSKAILKKLSEHFLTSYDELIAMQTETEPFFQSLKTKNGDIDVSQLKHIYEERYREHGGLNELLFLQNDPHLLPNSNKSQSSVITPSKECPVTPIRAAMNSIQELNNTLSSSQEEPCSQLKNYFQKCSCNPEASIISRVNKFRQQFCEIYVLKTNSSQRSIAEQRFKQAGCLYYRVMKMLLDMETERLSQNDFSKLLNNDTFHRSLLACSVEIVLITYNISCYPSRCRPESEDYVFAFPWILDVFHLFAYDFYKVLESFIKVETKLTREVVQHLTCIENKILDSIAWKTGSPVFEAIEKSETINTNFISPCDAVNGNGSHSTAAELYLSPVRGQRTRGTLQENVTSPAKSTQPAAGNQSKDSSQPKPVNSSKRSHSLNMFFNKVCRLGYHRLITLCDLLHVPKDTQQKIWTCLEFSITSCPQLMMDRHLDQIMMCSLYGICKVSECDIKFKDIVKCYSSLTHADPKVYKQTLIKDQQYDSIINFYNIVFMQTMKNFILQFAKPAQPNLSPVPRPVASSLNTSPVYRIQGRQNFYVSPLKVSPFKSIQSPGSMTPRSRQLYSFGDSLGSSMKLKSINESLSAFKSRNNQPCVTAQSRPVGKRLSFENTDDNRQNSPKSTDECSPAVVVKKKRVVPPKANTANSTAKH